MASAPAEPIFLLDRPLSMTLRDAAHRPSSGASPALPRTMRQPARYPSLSDTQCAGDIPIVAPKPDNMLSPAMSLAA